VVSSKVSRHDATPTGAIFYFSFCKNSFSATFVHGSVRVNNLVGPIELGFRIMVSIRVFG